MNKSVSLGVLLRFSWGSLEVLLRFSWGSRGVLTRKSGTGFEVGGPFCRYVDYYYEYIVEMKNMVQNGWIQYNFQHGTTHGDRLK